MTTMIYHSYRKINFINKMHFMVFTFGHFHFVRKYFYLGGGAQVTIDKEFEIFVSKNYDKLTESQKKLYEKLGISKPQ